MSTAAPLKAAVIGARHFSPGDIADPFERQAIQCLRARPALAVDVNETERPSAEQNQVRQVLCRCLFHQLASLNAPQISFV
jgi:hypothetical protein